jgi:tryptophan synthase beta subunit
VVLVSLSGRGDKDVDTASKWFGLESAASPVAAAAR